MRQLLERKEPDGPEMGVLSAMLGDWTFDRTNWPDGSFLGEDALPIKGGD